jgi:hypothetical protein
MGPVVVSCEHRVSVHKLVDILVEVLAWNPSVVFLQGITDLEGQSVVFNLNAFLQFICYLHLDGWLKTLQSTRRHFELNVTHPHDEWDVGVITSLVQALVLHKVSLRHTKELKDVLEAGSLSHVQQLGLFTDVTHCFRAALGLLLSGLRC